MNPIDLIHDACNDDDQLHAVIPTERDDDDLFVLTVRVQPAKRGDGEVVHLRTILVDLDAESATWQGNGMWMPVTSNLPLALGKALIGTQNMLTMEKEREEPLIKNGMGGGDDDLAAALLDVEREVETDEERDTSRPTPGTERYWDALDDHDGDEAAPADEQTVDVECHNCGQMKPTDEVLTVSIGGAEFFRCKGDCDD